MSKVKRVLPPLASRYPHAHPEMHNCTNYLVIALGERERNRTKPNGTNACVLGQYLSATSVLHWLKLDGWRHKWQRFFDRYCTKCQPNADHENFVYFWM